MCSTRLFCLALGFSFAILAPLCGFAQTQPAPETAPVKDGVTVHLEYTLKDEAGKIVESNKGGTPLVFTHGNGQIIPGLEKALLGMREGETKHVTVPPEDAYGQPDPTRVHEVSRERVPKEIKVGSSLVGQTSTGQPILAVVKEIKEQVVVLDFNHPMAGKTLIFDIKVLSVEPPKAADPPKPN